MKTLIKSSCFKLLVATGLVVTSSCAAKLARESRVKEDVAPLDPAAADLPISRFEKLLTSIENYLRSSTGDEATRANIEALAGGGIRNDLFKIQNLADLYKKRYPQFETIRSGSKALEDAVGGLRAAKEKLDFAIGQNAEADKIQRLRDLVESEANSVVGLMCSQSWNLGVAANKIKQFRDLVTSTQWDQPGPDRQYLFGALCGLLMDIDNKSWNMFDLNAENGLHNLKKAIRWHRLEMSLLTGDVLSSENNNCQNNQVLTEFNQFVTDQHIEASICAKDQYLPALMNLRNNKVCQLSACYLTRYDEAYTLLSAIKDEAEGLEAIGREISHDRLQQADDMYQALKRDQVFRMTSYELKSCLNKVN